MEHGNLAIVAATHFYHRITFTAVQGKPECARAHSFTSELAIEGRELLFWYRYAPDRRVLQVQPQDKRLFGMPQIRLIELVRTESPGLRGSGAASGITPMVADVIAPFLPAFFASSTAILCSARCIPRCSVIAFACTGSSCRL